MSDFIKQFQAARQAGAPLVAIRTPDPASTLRAVMGVIPKDRCPVLHWDFMRGMVGINQPGKKAQQGIMGDGKPEKVSAKPSEMLRYADLLSMQPIGEDVTIFMANAHIYWKDAATIQGIWNLRDQYKANGSMMVLMTTQGAVLPDELAQDVVIIDEPLPDAATLEAILRALWKSAELDAKDLTPVILEKVIDATIGLAAFPAEQAISMEIDGKGINLTGLWERKRQIIEQTPGLSVWRGGETFDAIGGVENVKQYLRRMMKGKRPPRVIVFIDEIEKAFAGMGTDSSGVKTEMTGTLLTWMQDKKARGVIFIGPPGAAKSVVAKAAGNDAGIPTIYFDLTAMQDSLVGKSGERLRSALKIIEAISQGRAFFIATCNKIKTLPPELRRRFKRGTWFFALPTKEERDVIWKIYEKKYGLSGKRPDDNEWTGAEIEQCCEQAEENDISLIEASQYVVPVARAAAVEIAELCEESHGKFIDASKPGVYKYDPQAGAPITVETAIRKIRKGEINVTPNVAEA